jgi:hypothetical protein
MKMKIDQLSFYKGVERTLTDVAAAQEADHSNIRTMHHWVKDKLREATVLVTNLEDDEAKRLTDEAKRPKKGILMMSLGYPLGLWMLSWALFAVAGWTDGPGVVRAFCVVNGVIVGAGSLLWGVASVVEMVTEDL